MKFFLNPGMSAHLRGLQEEFDESSNGIRLELNRLEEAGMLSSEADGQKKVFRVNTQHPLYNDINSLVRKNLGLDSLVEQVVSGLGGLKKVYLVGNLARGLDHNKIEIIMLGNIKVDYLSKVLSKVQTLIRRTVDAQVVRTEEELSQYLNNQAYLLLWSEDQNR